MNPPSKLSILVVGASGQLGSLITKHCLKDPNLLVNILIRNPDGNQELIHEVEKNGGKVIKADVTLPETLKGCTKGIHTIISALRGDEQVIIQGQKSLLQEALETGDVKRFVPAEYSIAYDKIEEDEHLFTGHKIRFRKILSKTPIKGLYFFPGMFVESFFSDNEGGFHYWENPDIKCDFTTYEDTARFIAAAVANPDRIGDLFIRGMEASTREIVEIYNKVRGTHFEAKRLGSLQDLKNQVANLKLEGEYVKAAYLGFAIPVVDGRGKFKEVQNSEFPEVKVTNLEEFLKQNPSIVVLL